MIWNRKYLKSTSPNLVYVGRPTKWGNPFIVKDLGLQKALSLYETWVLDEGQDKLREQARKELRGKDLVCWCAPRVGLMPKDPIICHAQILYNIANYNG